MLQMCFTRSIAEKIHTGKQVMVIGDELRVGSLILQQQQVVALLTASAS